MIQRLFNRFHIVIKYEIYSGAEARAVQRHIVLSV